MFVTIEMDYFMVGSEFYIDPGIAKNPPMWWFRIVFDVRPAVLLSGTFVHNDVALVVVVYSDGPSRSAFGYESLISSNARGTVSQLTHSK